MSRLIAIESKLAKNRTPIEKLMLAVAHASATRTRYVTGSHIKVRPVVEPAGNKLARVARRRRIGITTIR